MLRKWTPSYMLAKEELTSVQVRTKLHGVPVLAFTTDGLIVIATRLGTLIMLYSCTTTTFPNPIGNGVMMHTIKDFRGPLGSKKGTVDNGKHMDDMVDDTRKKMKAPFKKTPRKTGATRPLRERLAIFATLPETKVHYFDGDDTDFDDMGQAVEEVEHENAYRKNS
ncbi:hypothetical protein Tco_0787706 [Tanacetum coccineum]